MIYIGFDNGVTNNGIGVVDMLGEGKLYPLPVKRELSYTKEAKHITRVDIEGLTRWRDQLLENFPDVCASDIRVGLERPMVNSTRFNASLSAIRALEATLIFLESFNWAYEYIDSKEWQKALLPNGLKEATSLKKLA